MKLNACLTKIVNDRLVSFCKKVDIYFFDHYPKLPLGIIISV